MDNNNSTGMCRESVKLSFQMHGVMLKISEILPSRKECNSTRVSRKYDTILASIREVGIIEPPIVHPLGSGSNIKYLLMDGHMRIEALKELSQETVFCLISTDDETYTYNKRINSITPIQEHFMILNAINRGVSEEKIASALNVDVGRIREKRNLLDKICPEAIELLKDASAGAATIRKLRIVKPARQVEIVEMMAMVNNYSAIYCEALVAATPKEQLTEDGKAKKNPKLSTDDIARMEREMETLQRDMHLREDNYGRNFLDLIIVRGYLSKLLGNGHVVRYFSNNQTDLLEAFQQIIESTSLEG